MENRLIYKERFELKEAISDKEKQLQTASGKSGDIVREEDVQRRVDQVHVKIDRSPVSTENKATIRERFAHLLSLRAARIREIDDSAGEVLKKMHGDIKTELDEFLKQSGVFELATRIEQSIDRQNKIDKEINDREAEIAKIDEKLKDLSERQRRITDETLPTLYARLNKYTEENSIWTFLDEEKIIEQTVRLVEAGERVLEKLAQEMAKVGINKIKLTQEIYLLKYHQQQELGKNTDVLLLEIYDEMGQASPAQLEDQIEEAKRRAIENPGTDNFNKLLYQGKYQEALAVLNERNRELTKAVGVRFSEYDVLRFYEAWKGHPPYRVDEFSEDSYGHKLLQEGFTSVPLAGSQMGRLMVKENTDGSLSYVVVTVGGYAITMAKGYQMKRIAKERRDVLAQEHRKLEKDVRKVLSENPNLQNVQQASIVVQRKLSPLFAMFKAGQQGKKTANFILLAKRYASDIKNSPEIANLRNNAQKARADLEMLKKFGVGVEDEFEKEINQYQKALDRVIDAVESDQLLHVCYQISRDDYTEDDLKSWFVKEGLVMLTAILTATAAVVITISTCGVGGIAALALVAGIGSAGGIVGAEIGHLASEELGQVIYGETFHNKSFLGKYLSEEEIMDPETGKYKQISLAQLGKVYGEQFVMGFVTTFALLGLGKLAGAALSKFAIASQFNAGAGGALARMVLKLPKMNPQKLDLLEARGFKKVLEKVGSEFLEELGEEGVESAASRADAKLGFLVSVYNCLDGKQVELSFGKVAVVAEGNEYEMTEGDIKIISNFSYDSSTGVDVGKSVKRKYEAQGFEVSVQDGEIVCTKKMVAKDGTRYSNVIRFRPSSDMPALKELMAKVKPLLADLNGIVRRYQAAITNLPKEEPGVNEKTMILRKIKESLSEEERQLPSGELKALIRQRFYKEMSVVSDRAGKVMERIENYARENPDANYEEIIGIARDHGFDDLPAVARKKIRIAVLRFKQNRELIKTSLNSLSPVELFQAIFRFKPHDEVSLDLSSPFSIHFNVSKLDLFAAYNKDVIVAQRSTLEDLLSKKPFTVGGFHTLLGGLLTPLSGLVNLGRTDHPQIERIFMHEERHALHALFFSLGESYADLGRYRNKAYKLQNALYLKQKKINKGPKFIKLIRAEFPKILDLHRRGFLERGRDEIMAYLREMPLGEIAGLSAVEKMATFKPKLLKTGDAASYDYPTKEKESILGGWFPDGAKIRERMYAQMRARYRREISHAIATAVDVLETASTTEDRQALLAELSTTPVEAWTAVFGSRIHRNERQAYFIEDSRNRLAKLREEAELDISSSDESSLPLEHFNRWLEKAGEFLSEDELLVVMHELDFVGTVKLALQDSLRTIDGRRDIRLREISVLLDEVPTEMADELRRELLPLVDDVQDPEFKEMLDAELRLTDSAQAVSVTWLRQALVRLELMQPELKGIAAVSSKNIFQWLGKKIKSISYGARLNIAEQVADIFGINNLPESIQNHVPVYRAVAREYAGLPDKSGQNYWSIGAHGKKYSLAFLRDNPGNVLVRSTIGELRKCGSVRIHHEGEKLYLKDFTKLDVYEIIAENINP